MKIHQPRRSRIQNKNRNLILDAALQEFSARGFSGTTIDQIAETAGLSKPNVLYYFPSKEAIYRSLLVGLLDLWLAPLRELDAGGDPVEQILAYVRRKLLLSRDYPNQSRLFASEVLHGAPHMSQVLSQDLHTLVHDKVAIIAGWSASGQIAQVDPYHLIFSIWALTQHYADFDVQVRAVMGEGPDPYAGAMIFLEHLFRRMLAA